MMIHFPQKSFSDLSAKEILALAISSEEEDAHRYRDIADALRENYPTTAQSFEAMADEEDKHRRRLIDLHRQKFGDHIALIRREDVRGFTRPKPVWLLKNLEDLSHVRREVGLMEYQSRRFYLRAARRAKDAEVRKLLGDLAMAERHHEDFARDLSQNMRKPHLKMEDEVHKRLFLLQFVQPGLAGLMDGSVSTLAPLFAAAFATHNSWETFLVGLAASIGAGISMGFAEALSDDGSLTGRGNAWKRGLACGLMTVIGGLGHTLPYLVGDFYIATAIACLVVLVELAAISWIRHRYMDTPWLRAAFQVVIGGVLVFLTGILIGSA